MVLCDYSNLVLATEHGITTSRKEIAQIIENLNMQADSAALIGCASTDELVHKFDEVINFLSTLETCKLVVVPPATAENALQILEEKGGVEAAGKLVVIQDASSDDDETLRNSSRIVFTDNAFSEASKAQSGTLPVHDLTNSPVWSTDSTSSTFSTSSVTSSINGDGDDTETEDGLKVDGTLVSLDVEACASALSQAGADEHSSGFPTLFERELPPHLPVPSSDATTSPAPRTPSLAATTASALSAVAPAFSFPPTPSAVATPGPQKTLAAHGTNEKRTAASSVLPAIAECEGAEQHTPLPTPTLSAKGYTAYGVQVPAPVATLQQRSVTQPGTGEMLYAGSRNSTLKPRAWREPDRSKPFHHQNPYPPCNRHYLLEQGCSDPNCSYGHDFLLSIDDVHKLRLDSKKTPCLYVTQGRHCPVGPAKCHMGHACPYGALCNYGAKCKFVQEGMHDAPAILPPPRRTPYIRSSPGGPASSKINKPLVGMTGPADPATSTRRGGRHSPPRKPFRSSPPPGFHTVPQPAPAQMQMPMHMPLSMPMQVQMQPYFVQSPTHGHPAFSMRPYGLPM